MCNDMLIYSAFFSLVFCAIRLHHVRLPQQNTNVVHRSSAEKTISNHKYNFSIFSFSAGKHVHWFNPDYSPTVPTRTLCARMHCIHARYVLSLSTVPVGIFSFHTPNNNQLCIRLYCHVICSILRHMQFLYTKLIINIKVFIVMQQPVRKLTLNMTESHGEL